MRRIIIFGASAGGAVAFDALKDSFVITAFADNDPAKHGASHCGLPVIGPADLAREAPDLVVIASRACREIETQLAASGLDRDRIHVFPLDRHTSALALEQEYAGLQAELSALKSEAFEKVVVFGTGSRAKAAWDSLSARFEVLCFADNDASKQGTVYMGRRVIAPAAIPGQPFDRIIVASIHTREILDQLKGLGVGRDRIQCY
jgi:hypothetical protein